ncbi:MAG: lipocalin-like domain-containing protein [Bacteroidaceae bacterium]|nr:lipocalin-like domain-containing protein [Bacteroidaceae bacterium]
MKPNVKVRLYILALVAALLSMSSCDKKDCNGDLDGMWQLTEWRSAEGTVKATKQDMIFYSFQLQMSAFLKSGESDFYMRALLKVSPDQITIYNPFDYVGDSHDEVRPMSVLAAVGVPEDGIFRIETLTSSQMLLKTNAGDLLSFRKY